MVHINLYVCFKIENIKQKQYPIPIWQCKPPAVLGSRYQAARSQVACCPLKLLTSDCGATSQPLPKADSYLSANGLSITAWTQKQHWHTSCPPALIWMDLSFTLVRNNTDTWVVLLHSSGRIYRSPWPHTHKNPVFLRLWESMIKNKVCDLSTIT